MVVITFPDTETQKKAVGFLLGSILGQGPEDRRAHRPRGRAGGPRGAKTSPSPSTERRRMKSKSRRYEVLLPVRFNDGRDVPEELLGEAVNEIVEQFGAVSFHKDAVEGHWRHDETLYRDDLALLVVDVPERPRTASG